MPSSLQARWIRSAISPRLAIRTLSNILSRRLAEGRSACRRACPKSVLYNDDVGCAEFDRLPILDEDVCHRPGAGRWDVVHGFPRLDDHQRLPLRDPRADLDEGRRAWLRRTIGGADHRGLDAARMIGEVDAGVSRCRRLSGC